MHRSQHLRRKIEIEKENLEGSNLNLYYQDAEFLAKDRILDELESLRRQLAEINVAWVTRLFNKGAGHD